MVILRQLSVLH